MQRGGGVLVLDFYALGVHHGIEHPHVVQPDAVVVLFRRIRSLLPETRYRNCHRCQQQPNRHHPRYFSHSASYAGFRVLRGKTGSQFLRRREIMSER